VARRRLCGARWTSTPEIWPRETLREGYEILTEVGEFGYRAPVASNLAAVLARQGHVDEAERLVADVVETSTSDDLDPQVRWRAVQGLVLAARGEHAEAERLAREAVELAERTDYLLLRAEAFSALADVLAAAGRWNEAAAAVERALAELERKQDVAGAALVRARLEELRAKVPPDHPGTIVAT
jgi:ATP/maltotriose-dependent transcriptional regulator MalT